MKKQEIIDAIAKAKKQLAVAKEQDEKDFAQHKITRLEGELKDTEAEETAKADISGKKPKDKKAKVEQSFDHFKEKVTQLIEKKQGLSRSDAQGFAESHKTDLANYYDKGLSPSKTIIKLFPRPKKPAIGKNISDILESESGKSKGTKKLIGKMATKNVVDVDTIKRMSKTHGKFSLVSEGEAEQEVSKNLVLHKISDTVYDLRHKGKSTFEFTKKQTLAKHKNIEGERNRWHVTCKIKDRIKKEGFESLNAAVIYVAKFIYSEDLKEYFESKKKSAARVKEFKQKHPTGATTAAQDVTKAVEKATEKLEEKVENDESIKKQTDAIISQIIELLKSLKALDVAKADLEKISKELN